jgi:hypothetical protein
MRRRQDDCSRYLLEQTVYFPRRYKIYFPPFPYFLNLTLQQCVLIFLPFMMDKVLSSYHTIILLLLLLTKDKHGFYQLHQHFFSPHHSFLTLATVCPGNLHHKARVTPEPCVTTRSIQAPVKLHPFSLTVAWLDLPLQTVFPLPLPFSSRLSF